jgi:tartrate-resistant acid phosphatase type 5
VRLRLDRRTVLQGMAATALSAAAPARAQTAPLAFLAVGDWGREGGRSQTAVAQAMAQAARETGSQFVLSVGDNFYPGGVTSARDAQWRTSFEDVYADASLQTPWYAALGNHDYRGEPEAQLDYGRVAGRWRMPDRHYVVEAASGADLEIFVLDTTPLVADYGEALLRLCRGHVATPDPAHQLQWFSSRLARSRAAWKVVVGHHPIHSGGRHGGEPALARSIEPLLQAYGVQAYVYGHDHALQHIQVDATHHICSGAGSSAGAAADIAGTRFCASTPGFALFRLRSTGLELEFRDAAGRTLHQASLAT